MMFKKYIVRIIIMVTCLIINSGCKQNMLTKEKIIDIANREVISRGLQLDDKEIYYDIDNVKWKNTLSDLRENSTEFAKRYNVLEGRDYQAVVYSPKNKQVIGGVFWVFVDRKTSEVITVYGEK